MGLPVGSDSSIETCILPYVNQMTCANLVHEDGALAQPRGMGGEGGGRVVQDGGTHVHPWLIHVDVWQKP